MQASFIKLPRTSPEIKNYFRFAKLLYFVDPHAERGFGFHGVMVAPGARVPRSIFDPTNRFPDPPLLLECAPGELAGIRGNWRRSALWILWQLDHPCNWRELARGTSIDWTWALSVRPVAVEALRAAGITSPPHFEDEPGPEAEAAEDLGPPPMLIRKGMHRSALVRGGCATHECGRFCESCPYQRRLYR